MNQQQWAYETLISAANYCIVFSFDDSGLWQASKKIDELAISLCTGGIDVDIERTLGNLNKWHHIRELAGWKPLQARARDEVGVLKALEEERTA